MAASEVSCPHCGQKVSIEGAPAGQSVKCSHCGKEFAAGAAAASGAVTQVIPGLAGMEERQGELSLRTPLTGIIDLTVGGLRFFKRMPEGFWKYQNLLSVLGVFAILAGGLLAFLHHAIVAIRSNSLSLFLVGGGILIASVLLHYVAARFAGAGQNILRKTPERMNCPALADCLGLLAALLGIAAFVMGIVQAIQLRSFIPFIGGGISLLVLGHLAVFCLNPKECMGMVVEAGGMRAGHTALSVLTFIYRCLLAMVPAVLGLVGAGGVIWMFVSMVRSWFTSAYDLALVHGEFMSGAGLVVFASLTPIVAYVLYVLAMLAIDLCLAIFHIEENTKARS